MAIFYDIRRGKVTRTIWTLTFPSPIRVNVMDCRQVIKCHTSMHLFILWLTDSTAHTNTSREITFIEAWWVWNDKLTDCIVRQTKPPTACLEVCEIDSALVVLLVNSWSTSKLWNTMDLSRLEATLTQTALPRFLERPWSISQLNYILLRAKKYDAICTLGFEDARAISFKKTNFHKHIQMWR